MQSSELMSNQETFVITGASKGLGRSIATLLAKNGYIVIGLARASKELSSLDITLKSFNPKSTVLECDLSSPEEVNDIGNLIVDAYSSIEGLVHNAGIIGPVDNMFTVNADEWDAALQVNLCSVQRLTAIIYDSLAAKNGCRVTTISSGAAINSLPSWSAYCTSKAALEMWTKCLAQEGMNHNITAISFAPGIVDTGMQATIRSVSKEKFPMVDRFIDFHENGDLSDSDDVAKAMFSLITQHDKSVSGQRFDVRDL